MRRTLVLAAAAVGAAAALLPAGSASAQCVALYDGQDCYGCGEVTERWNQTADGFNERYGDDLGVGLARIYCTM